MEGSTRAPAIAVGQLEIRFLVESPSSNGSVSVFECRVPTGAKVPAPHSHDGFEETVYGLDGVSTWTIDGEIAELGPGDALCIKRGAAHGFVNRAGAETTFLAIATPGLIGPAYFSEVGEVIAGSAAGPPDPAAIAEVMLRHGLTPVASPTL